MSNRQLKHNFHDIENEEKLKFNIKFIDNLPMLLAKELLTWQPWGIFQKHDEKHKFK